MFRTLAHHRHQFFVLASLVLTTGLCLALVGVRVTYARNLVHAHLIWNLFLAWLPMLPALIAYNVHRREAWFRRLMVVGCVGMWLLFFPNAPYMVTDVIHLWSRGDGVPLWYDLILIIAFAWTSFYLGLVSLYLMQALVRKAIGPLTSWAFAIMVLAVSGFGVYLGRFQRWNSWDVFTAPVALLRDVYTHVRHPMANREALVFSLLFSLFCFCAYLMLTALMGLSREEKSAVPVTRRG
jgi:uncharacterized membrane protein